MTWIMQTKLCNDDWEDVGEPYPGEQEARQDLEDHIAAGIEAAACGELIEFDPYEWRVVEQKGEEDGDRV